MINYDEFLSATGRQLHESAIRRMGTVVARETDLVSFAAGYPDPSSFPSQELGAIAAELLGGRDGSALQYGPTRGHRPLLEAILGLLDQRGIAAALEDIIVTSGSQQGIDLVARVLVSPGDVVLVELPTFTGAIAAFRNVQADVVGVAQDPDGINLDDLEIVCQREHRAGKRIKVLYLVPNFQNPTGMLLSVEKRKHLLDWAERRNVLLVEDDPYGSLYFEDVATEKDTRPMRADDSRGRVIYLSSFSKTLAPGFRVGWMVAPATLIERFDTAKQSADLTSGILDQRIVLEAIQRGLVESLAPQLRALYRRKRDVMEHALRSAMGDRLTWQQPKGGFFVWATLAEGYVDTEVLDLALKERLVFVVGSAFFVNGAGHNTMRLTFSAPPIDRIPEGVRRLAVALDRAKARCDEGAPSGKALAR